MDLGRKLGDSLATKPQPQRSTSYPSFSLSDEAAEKFGEEYDCEVGDELTATVRLRVSGIRKDEYGHSKTFDVLSIDDVKEEGSEEEESEETPAEESEEEKILGYKRPEGKRETPPLNDLSA